MFKGVKWTKKSFTTRMNDAKMKRLLALLTLGFFLTIKLAAQEKKMEKGLVGYWSFDEGEGSIAKDSLGIGNHAEINGAKWVKGKFGNALEFNGVDAYVDCGTDDIFNITDALTVEAWARPLKGNAYQRGIVEKSIQAGYTGWSLYQTTNGYLFRVAVSDGTLKAATTGAGTIIVGIWTYVVGVKDANNIYIYMNGELKMTTPAPLPIASNSQSVKIGWYGYMSTGDVYFNGLIDEVGIYNRALTGEEIKKRYEEKIKSAGTQKGLLVTPYFVKISPEVGKNDREIPSLNILWMDSEKNKQNVSLKIIDESDAIVAENKFVLTANEPETWEIPNQKISDGKYRIEAEINKKPLDEPVGIIEVSDFYWARLADSLPGANFERRTLHCHGPGALQTPEEVREMVRRAKAMGFTDIYFNLKSTSGSVYYSSKIGYPAPVVSKFDPFAIAVEESKKQNIRIIAYFCVFREDRNAPFLKDHPDWVEVDKGEPSDYRKQKYIFGCPDRPEVREFELSLMREVLTNYQVDGIALDYIRYKNDYACYCDYSQKTLVEYMRENPGLTEERARAKRAEETIVGMTVSIRNLMDSMKKGLTLSAYVHPTYADKFPLDYHSRRASAHGNDPERGGEWSLEKVYNEAKKNVELAKKSPYSFQKPAPMADTAYRNWAKSPKRFQREIRLIKYAGANDIDIYLYDTLKFKPELRKMIAEEFGGNPEEAVK